MTETTRIKAADAPPPKPEARLRRVLAKKEFQRVTLGGTKAVLPGQIVSLTAEQAEAEIAAGNAVEPTEAPAEPVAAVEAAPDSPGKATRPSKA